MTDTITITAVGLIGLINVIGMALLSRQVKHVSKQLEKIKFSQTWSKKRELEANKMLKKIIKHQGKTR